MPENFWTQPATLPDKILDQRLFYGYTDVPVNNLRCKMYGASGKVFSDEKLAPCFDSLKQHSIKPANYQAAVWKRSLECNPTIPDAVGHEWMLSVWFLKEMWGGNLLLLRQWFSVYGWLSHSLVWKYDGELPQQRIGCIAWGRGWLTGVYFWNDKFGGIFKVKTFKLYLIYSYNGILDFWHFTDQNNNLQTKIINT